MPTAVQPLPTVGQIARLYRVPVHRVEYIIDTRNVQHIGTAGNARVFALDDVEYIGAELRRIAAEREGISA